MFRKIKIMDYIRRLFKSIGKRIRYIIIRPAFYKIFKWLYYFSIKGMGVLNYENNKLSGEKHFINHILKKILDDKNEYVFIDVGANVGKYSSLLLNNFSNSKIYSFEPHPENYKILNSINNKNLYTYNQALGNSEGQIEFFDFKDSGGTELASIYHDVISHIHNKEAELFQVKIRMLDNICTEEGIKYIDFLKIDTEGHELFVLEGAKNLIKNNAIKCIHFEFNEMNVISKVHMRDFISLLADYELYRLLPRGMIKIDDCPVLSEIYAYQNIIAVYE